MLFNPVKFALAHCTCLSFSWKMLYKNEIKELGKAFLEFISKDNLLMNFSDTNEM